jgi:hypothetical protein
MNDIRIRHALRSDQESDRLVISLLLIIFDSGMSAQLLNRDFDLYRG